MKQNPFNVNFLSVGLIFILPLFFKTQLNAQSIEIKDEVFSVVEKMPTFPGGRDSLLNYLKTNLKYPQAALDKGTTGIVVVQFIVEKDGSIGETKAVKGIGDGCDEEAIRLVKAMPKWSPGVQAGRQVRVKFNLPVRF